MNDHSKLFFRFLDEMHTKNIPYVIFRGFSKLPVMPDKDIDMLGCNDHYVEIVDMCKKYFVENNNICGPRDYGFAEWCQMLLNPFFTSLERETWLPDGDRGLGYFRIDLQNSLYFKSPYNNFNTYWTVPKKFNDYVLETRRIRKHDGIYYYIPSIECDMTLLTLRNTLDKNRKWKDKHANRVNELAQIADKNELTKCVKMVLPESIQIVEHLLSGNLNEINNIIEKL